MAVKELGIVIYGVCNNRDGFWEEWLDRALSVCSLPKDYHTELDSSCYLSMNVRAWGTYEKYSNYAYCELNFDECSKELVEKIKSVLLELVEMELCEIFTMDKAQVPYNYGFKGMGDDISKYRTLEVLSRTCN